jgi:hypothetical protein
VVAATMVAVVVAVVEETSFRGTQTEHKLSSKEAEQVGTTFERI